MPDAAFADPRLAVLYDEFEGPRDDLDLYRAVAAEFRASSVLDVGCGTGSLACALAADGLDVVGLDPARASLDLARQKHHADEVVWIEGGVEALPRLRVDLAVMTGNVAQVFVDDNEWGRVLSAIRRSVGPGGRLVFETRDPARRAWTRWTPELSRTVRVIDSVGEVETWVETLDVSSSLVTFRWTYRFVADGTTLTSRSTLRFRSRPEIERSLEDARWSVDEVRDAPDRPGDEWVFLARPC